MIKNFDKFKNKPSVGDWIINIANNIGVILSIEPNEYNSNAEIYMVKYDNNNVLVTPETFIRYFGTKEEIETFLLTKKYNL